MTKLLNVIGAFLILSLVLSCSLNAPFEDNSFEEFPIEGYNQLWGSEFNSQKDFENRWVPQFLLAENELSIHGMEAKDIITDCGIGSFNENDIFEQELYCRKSSVIENGTLKNLFFGERKNLNKSSKYQVHGLYVSSGYWDNSWRTEKSCLPKNYFHVKFGNGKKKIITMRFKKDFSPSAFEFLLLQKAPRTGKQLNGVSTTKGYYVDEIDLMELIVQGGETCAKSVRPAFHLSKVFKGGKHVEGTDPNGTPIKNSIQFIQVDNKEEWCDSWHEGIWELDDSSLTVYIDGEKIGSVNWEQEYGKLLDVEYSIILWTRPFNCWLESPLDWNSPIVHSTEIDYVRVYEEY